MLGVTKTRFWQTKMLVCVRERAFGQKICYQSLQNDSHTHKWQLHRATDWPSLTVINGASGKQLTERKQGMGEDVLYTSHPQSLIHYYHPRIAMRYQVFISSMCTFHLT